MDSDKRIKQSVEKNKNAGATVGFGLGILSFLFGEFLILQGLGIFFALAGWYDYNRYGDGKRWMVIWGIILNALQILNWWILHPLYY